MSPAYCSKCNAELAAGSEHCHRCLIGLGVAPVDPAGIADLDIPGYKILDVLGEGGMGRVYLAEDIQLERQVAIKVIVPDLLDDPSFESRFLREARAMARVGHVNVVGIHAFGRAGDRSFMVMEYVEGESLEAHLAREGALPFGAALRYLRDVVAALEAAWQHGIIHRDIKPSNLLIGTGDRVRVVDFGLAKSVDVVGTSAVTDVGGVLGTPHYLSPEQALGKALDFRSDFYALGIVLFEMLAGRRPFEPGPGANLIDQHLHSPLPSLRKLREDIPDALARLCAWMTRKDPADRPRDHVELLRVIDALLPSDLSTSAWASATTELIPPWPPELAPPAWRQRRWQLGSMLTAIGAVVMLYVTLGPVIAPPGGRGAEAAGKMVAMLAPAEHAPLTFTGNSFRGELSPDGTLLAYIQMAGNWETHRLMLKDLTQDSMTSEPLTLFEAHRISRVRWSPLGTELLVSAQIDDGEFGRYLIPRWGGLVREIDGKTPGGWHSWAPDGRRFGVTKGMTAIHFVDIATGDFEEVLVEMPYTLLFDWEWSPAGEVLAFLGFIEDLDQTQILTMRADGGPMVSVYTGSKWLRHLRWSGDGTSLYFLDVEGPTSTLLRVQVDPLSGIALGEPEAMLSGLETESFSLSRERSRLVYDKHRSWSNLSVVTLGEVDGEIAVRTRQLTTGTYHDSEPSLSPDGSQLAFVRGNEPELSAVNDVYVVPLAGGLPRRLTFTREREGFPSWSPDGVWLAYGSDAGGASKVWKVAASGGSPQVFDETDLSATHRVTWAPGSRIAYQRPGNRNYLLLDPETEEQRPLLSEEEGWIGFPQFSHDGTRVAARWLRASKRAGIWVLPLEGSVERLIYEKDGEPVGWSADDAWVYIWDYNRKAVRVPAAGGEAEILFQMPFEGQDGKCVVGRDVSQWICAAGAATTDIWQVDDFDLVNQLERTAN